MSGLLDLRLVFVTGKGGVGRTTVASALGLLASEEGRRCLVCEMQPSGDLARALSVPSLDYRPTEVAPGLAAMAMSTEAALHEYLRLRLRVSAVARFGPVAHLLGLLATAAPGVREILTVGKLCYEVREDHYDLVVVDATASGHIVGHLAAPVALHELMAAGPVRAETEWMLDILSDPARCGVVIVATPEEAPVNEAIELAATLARDGGVALAAAVGNRVLPELFGQAEGRDFAALSTKRAAGRLSGALGEDPAVLAAVLDAASLAVKLRRSGAAHLERLRDATPADVPVLALPEIFGAVEGRESLGELARALGDELPAREARSRLSRRS